ncbi:MAG: hypothetical protein OSA98_14190 [Rubripirellula sp.]|nr:hypothetical protein [Rubripirellula sp.]
MAQNLQQTTFTAGLGFGDGRRNETQIRLVSGSLSPEKGWNWRLEWYLAFRECGNDWYSQSITAFWAVISGLGYQFLET